MKVKSESEDAQLSPTLHDPIDCSPPDSSLHEIFQARVLEWGAIVSLVLAGKFFTASTTWEVVNVGNIEDSLLNMTSKAENRKKNNDTLDGMRI